jgi:hypothetical protein
MDTTIRHTSHAARRQAQRNLSDQDIQFIWEHGRQIRCAGALHVFLGLRDIPLDKETYQQFAHLEGATLVINHRSDVLTLVTVYRNRRGFKKIRHKLKYDCSTAGIDESYCLSSSAAIRGGLRMD